MVGNVREEPQDKLGPGPALWASEAAGKIDLDTDGPVPEE